MFTANFYSSTADARQRDKSNDITLIAAGVPITPTAALDTLSPALIVDYNAALLNANYIYIPAFNRYYFAAPPIIDVGKRMTFSCTVDVLSSVSDMLGNIDATIVRSESVGAPTYIPDNKLPINPVQIDLESIKFSYSPFVGAGRSYILTTLGGGTE